jgi:hypothetical protein
MNEDQLPGVNGGIWDAVHIYEGLGWEFLDPSSAFNQFDGRDITIKGGYSQGECPIPSANINWTIDGCDLTGCGFMEIDKQIVTANIKNLTMHGIAGQNPTELLILDNVTITTALNGTGKSCIIRNGCNIPSGPLIGPDAYGTAANNNSLICSDSTFAGGFGVPGLHISGISTGYTLTDGVISFTRAGNDVPQWLVPGAWVSRGGLGGHSTYGFGFQIIDTFDDGTTVYITTNLSGSVWANGFGSIICAIPQVTFANCTGCEEVISWSNCTPLKPLNSRWNRTYSGVISGLPVIPVYGRIMSASFTVTSGYSAGQFYIDDPFVAGMADDSINIWGPHIDLTQVGTRTITYNTGTNTYSNSAPLGSDAFAIPGTGAQWMFSDQMTPKMTGASGSGTIQFQLVTDQGIIEPIPYRRIMDVGY